MMLENPKQKNPLYIISIGSGVQMGREPNRTHYNIEIEIGFRSCVVVRDFQRVVRADNGT